MVQLLLFIRTSILFRIRGFECRNSVDRTESGLFLVIRLLRNNLISYTYILHMIKRNAIIVTLVIATNSTITTATTTSTRWTISSALTVALYYAIRIYTNALISCLLFIHLMR